MSRPVLLTVSGTIPPDLEEQIAAGRRPRADYLELAAACDADLLDDVAARATGRTTRWIGRLAGRNVLLAWACFRRRTCHRVVFTDGEQVGLPYAALTWAVRRRPRHIMIGHRLSAPKKVRLHRLLRLQHRVDVVVVYASAQRQFAVERLGYRPDQVVLLPFMVDTRFWRPGAVPPDVRQRPLIAAAGQELRDYPTLVEAVRQLDVDLVIAAASPWSKRADTSAGLDIPDNVTVRRLDLFELRQLYAESAMVVVPLQETDFQAGITTILEAMAMGLAVICTATTGQTDTLVDGVNGRYVPPADIGAMRAAIEALVAAPDEVARFGESGRRWVDTQADIEVYAGAMARLTGGA